MKMIPNEENDKEMLIKGGAFDDVLNNQGPFMLGGKVHSTNCKMTKSLHNILLVFSRWRGS